MIVLFIVVDHMIVMYVSASPEALFYSHWYLVNSRFCILRKRWRAWLLLCKKSNTKFKAFISLVPTPTCTNARAGLLSILNSWMNFALKLTHKLKIFKRRALTNAFDGQDKKLLTSGWLYLIYLVCVWKALGFWLLLLYQFFFLILHSLYFHVKNYGKPNGIKTVTRTKSCHVIRN